MKNRFSEFYNLSQTEIDNLWSDGIFIVDANVLLDFYRFPKATSDTLLEVLKKIKSNNQLWIPYQIGLEFHKHRGEIIEIENNEYKRLASYFSNKLPSDVEAVFTENCNNHPFINNEKYLEEVKKMGSKISKSIIRLEKKHPDYRKKDNVLDELTELYDDCVGDEFTGSKLADIYKEGNERYLKKIPPGFMDSKKTEPEKYGDLVLWFQMIAKSKESKKPIIFITRDTKEDWWLFNNNREKKGARRELVKEMHDKAETKFYLYEISHFLKLASQKLNIEIDKKLTKEIKINEPVATTDEFHTKVAEGYTNSVTSNISSAQVGTVSSNIETVEKENSDTKMAK